MDLGDWRPLGNVPQNDALLEQKRLSLRPEDQALVELLEKGELPYCDEDAPNFARSGNDEVPGLYEHIRKSTPMMKGRSEQQLRTVLRDWGCLPERRKGERGWRFPSLKVLRSRFPSWDWSNPDQEDWEWSM